MECSSIASLLLAMKIKIVFPPLCLNLYLGICAPGLVGKSALGLAPESNSNTQRHSLSFFNKNYCFALWLSILLSYYDMKSIPLLINEHEPKILSLLSALSRSMIASSSYFLRIIESHSRLVWRSPLKSCSPLTQQCHVHHKHVILSTISTCLLHLQESWQQNQIMATMIMCRHICM